MKKTLTFSLLTLGLILLIIYGGVPFLIRMATFFGDIKSSKQLTEKTDTTPPFPPKLRPLVEATNSAQVIVKGFAEEGAIVQVFLNGEMVKEVVADADGSFTADNLSLSLGNNKIQAKAIDQAGNESQESGKMIITYDEMAPVLEIISPENNQEISGEENKVTIKGKTEAGISLKINDRLVILDQEGQFEQTFSLNEGENTILIVATDRAGNQTEEEINLTYSP